MKYKLPSSTVAFFLAFLPLLADSAAADDGGSPSQGNDLMAAAAANLAGFPALEAKLRQRVKLFGHEMVGSGTYQQMTAGRQRMSRLDFKMDVAGQVTSFQQISDGTTLWIRRDAGQEQSLEYVNLRQIRQALARLPVAQSLPQTGNWFALGGLDQLLHELNRNFDFSPPKPSQIGTVPVWELRGVWKPDALTRFGVMTDEELPSYLPQAVKVTLGRDQQLPLFPYRIEYGRRSIAAKPGPTTSATPSYVAIAAMDLHGVQHRPDLTARHFRFQPNEQEVVDVTQRYLDRLIARIEPGGDDKSDGDNKCGANDEPGGNGG